MKYFYFTTNLFFTKYTRFLILEPPGKSSGFSLGPARLQCSRARLWGMASPRLLGWAVRGHVQRQSGFHQACLSNELLLVPVMWFSLQTHSHLTRHERKKKRKVCPHSWFPRISNHKNVGKPCDVQAIQSPRRPQDGNVAPLAWSLKLCMWTVRPSCVNLQCWGSVEESGWRVCNTDHTGSEWRASAPAENPAVPCMCVSERPASQGNLEFLDA